MSAILVPIDSAANARRNALLCTLFFIVCALATFPVSNDGYIDDFSYVKTALDFAHTGHIVYNGWATAMLGWQVVWGGLIIKLFGFSFTALRLSTLPFAAASVYLFHQTLVRFGIGSRNAVIGTLTLCLTPVFFALSVSFMTDVPGLFTVLLALYLCQRAIAASSHRATIFWLVCATIVGLIGGTGRQTSWLGALVMVPSTAWFLRRRSGALLTGMVCAMLSLIVVLLCMRWFAAQPYIFPEPKLTHPNLAKAWTAIRQLIRAALALLLLLLPLVVGWLALARSLRRATVLRLAVFLCVLAVILVVLPGGPYGQRERWLMPWLDYSIVNRQDYVEQIDQLTASATVVPIWLRGCLTVLYAGAVLIMARFMIASYKSRPSKVAGDSNWSAFFWINGPFCLAYVLLLIPRASTVVLYDRYDLCLMPAAIALLLLLYQRWVADALPAVSVVVLAVIAMYSIADTHDYYANSRAADAALRELNAAGIPRTAVSQSFNSDGWVQLSIAGHLHFPGSASLDGAANPQDLNRHAPPGCEIFMLERAPVIHAKYVLVMTPGLCLQPSNYPPVNYRIWMPPFHRTEYIYQMPEGSRWKMDSGYPSSN